MAEEVKKSRPAPDPNSAKFKLGQIAAKAYSDAMEAKKRGEMVGWCASNFPVENSGDPWTVCLLPGQTRQLVLQQEAAVRECVTRQRGEGYSNDICAYARISLAYAKLKSAPEQDMPMPDFVLCCNNICNCMIKWYENLAKELNIPMFMIDIPYQPGLRGIRCGDRVHQGSVLGCYPWSGSVIPARNGAMSASKRLWLPPDAQAAHGSRQPPRQNMFHLRLTDLTC